MKNLHKEDMEYIAALLNQVDFSKLNLEPSDLMTPSEEESEAWDGILKNGGLECVQMTQEEKEDMVWVPRSNWDPQFDDETTDERMDDYERAIRDDRAIRMSIAKGRIDEVTSKYILAVNRFEPEHNKLLREIETVVDDLCTDPYLGHNLKREVYIQFSAGPIAENDNGNTPFNFACKFRVQGDAEEINMLANELGTLLRKTRTYKLTTLSTHTEEVRRDGYSNNVTCMLNIVGKARIK